ncbi:MAG: RimJ/RimL family protein N-acetyltransferase [Paraglaciecola sp.]|jgi:RimJ/RimL family protein N-acetyltransferase
MIPDNWQPGALLQLETTRFTLGSMLREDVSDEFINWMADPDVMVGLNMNRRRLSRIQAVRFVLGFDNHRRFCVGVKDKVTKGLIGFFILDCDLIQQTAETSVVIGAKEYWGKNVVMETRSCLLDFLFIQMDMVKVFGRPHGRNFSSIYNYKALGFVCEAVLRQHMKAIKGEQRLDQLVFGILKPEWQKKQQELME